MARERTSKKKESQARQIWKRFRKNKIAMAALVVLGVIILAACTADLFWDYQKDACKINVPQRLQKPSAAHWLGTDELGRDMLCRIVYGARASLTVGLAATTFALIIGGILGSISGYYGGKLDNVIMRCTDVLLAIPGLLLAIAIMSAFKPNVF